MNNRVKVILEMMAAVATIIGLCIALVALIPAFGQWLFPIANKPIISTITSGSTPVLSTPILLSTNTPTITPPPITPPPDGILFRDDFNNGINPNWQRLDEHWMTGNGALTLVASDDIQRRYIWLDVGNDSWRNYRIEFDVIKFGHGAVIVGVRNRSEYFIFDETSWGCWTKTVLDSPYYYPQLCLEPPHSYPGNLTGNFTLELDVQGDEYTASFDGQEFQKITIGEPENGNVSLGVKCDGECAHIDNFKVTYLP